MGTVQRVLNVDDDDAARYVKSKVLKNAGYEVVEATTGSEAFEILLEQPPEIAVLDVKLPDVCGHDISRRIKGDQRTRHIPVIEISAVCTTEQDEENALKSGADYFLTYPCDPVVLATVVTTVAKLQSSRSVQEAQRRSLAQYLNRTGVGIIQCDLYGYITKVNQRACELLGRSAAELCRLTYAELPHHDEARMLGALFGSLVRGEGSDFRVELRCPRPDGTSVWVETNVSLMRSGAGVVRGTVIAMADIGEQRASCD
jgi:PAS domain S-box-containing protein